MGNIAISGFGRIGRLAARIWFLRHQNTSSLVAINTSGSMDLEGVAHLLKYDTVYGRFPGDVDIDVHQGREEVTSEDPLLGHIVLDKNIRIPILAVRDPSNIPWSQYSTDLVIESTGVFRDEDGARKHIEAGAKQVLISAPGKGGSVETVVLGVTETSNGKEIYSSESCTTNCTATVVSAIHERFGVEKAFMTTVHAYTDDQKLQDGSHKDLRRARAAAANIIPTSTGAATATTRAIKELEGNFDGLAIRVPVLTGSLMDLTVVARDNTTTEELNAALIEASETPRYKGIIATTSDPIVSSDVIGRSESALIDLSLTKVIGGNLLKVFAWYDNEWGFTNRLVETAVSLAGN